MTTDVSILNDCTTFQLAHDTKTHKFTGCLLDILEHILDCEIVFTSFFWKLLCRQNSSLEQ